MLPEYKSYFPYLCLSAEPASQSFDSMGKQRNRFELSVRNQPAYLVWCPENVLKATLLSTRVSRVLPDTTQPPPSVQRSAAHTHKPYPISPPFHTVCCTPFTTNVRTPSLHTQPSPPHRPTPTPCASQLSPIQGPYQHAATIIPCTVGRVRKVNEAYQRVFKMLRYQTNHHQVCGKNCHIRTKPSQSHIPIHSILHTPPHIIEQGWAIALP